MSVSNNLLNGVRAAGSHHVVLSLWERSGMEMNILCCFQMAEQESCHGSTLTKLASWRAALWDRNLCEDSTRRAILFLKFTVAGQNLPPVAKICYFPWMLRLYRRFALLGLFSRERERERERFPSSPVSRKANWKLPEISWAVALRRTIKSFLFLRFILSIHVGVVKLFQLYS